MKRLFFLCLCLLYIIGPILNTPLGLYGDPILWCSIFLLVYLFCSKYSILICPRLFLGLFEKPLVLLQFYMIFPFLGSMFFTEYGNVVGLSDVIRPIRIVLTMYAGIALVLIANKLYGKMFFCKLLKVIVYVILLNAVVMCAQTFSDHIRDFLHVFLYRVDDGVNRAGLDLRASGLFLSGGALPSAFQTMVTVFIPYLIKKKEFTCGFGFMLAFILFVTSIFTGRSGLLVVFPFLYSVFTFLPFGQSIKILLFTISGVAIFISYIGIFGGDAFVYAIERLGWLGNESMKSGTVATILEKLSIPDSLFILFFGVLNFNNAVYTHVSDMGFNIVLWTYGLIGWLLFYWPYIKMLVFTYQFKSQLYNEERILVLIFLFTYLLFEFKENMMYARNGLSILSLLIYGYVLYRQKCKFLEGNRRG